MSAHELLSLFGLEPFTPERATAAGLSSTELRALVHAGRLVEQLPLFGDGTWYSIAVAPELVR